LPLAEPHALSTNGGASRSSFFLRRLMAGAAG
jgi:hypothetical protein